MIELPEFTEDGLLPPGDYVKTIEELKRSMLVLGPRNCPIAGWNAEWRGELVDNLGILVAQLQAAGITEKFIDGSFVEDEPRPNDIDGYFAVEERRYLSGALERELNRLDPAKVWTWDESSRIPFRGYPKGQLPMWHKYRVELYPDYGQFSGIRDAAGQPLEFSAAFRRSRLAGKPRGIVKIGAPYDKD